MHQLFVKKIQSPALFNAFEFLGLAPKAEISTLSIEQMMAWAINRYDLQHVPKVPQIQISQADANQATVFKQLIK